MGNLSESSHRPHDRARYAREFDRIFGKPKAEDAPSVPARAPWDTIPDLDAPKGEK